MDRRRVAMLTPEIVSKINSGISPVTRAILIACRDNYVETDQVKPESNSSLSRLSSPSCSSSKKLTSQKSYRAIKPSVQRKLNLSIKPYA
ncbi:hypothetical protein CRG98_021094 [Punica granatum]|uniref:Uncharacterized protein n=1 Tax=Punica granatum TaxID=22663 RepID=A0A2I0JRL1_PUNGR|nr:hypothetical protein CRG98_021094 [Punica granatum]